jgi:hypothetical protein
VTNALAYNTAITITAIRSFIISSGPYDARSKWTLFWSKPLALTSNTRLGQKRLTVTNALAYNTATTITTIRSFIISSGPYDAWSNGSPFWSKLLALPSNYKPRTEEASSDKHTSLQ